MVPFNHHHHHYSSSSWRLLCVGPHWRQCTGRNAHVHYGDQAFPAPCCHGGCPAGGSGAPLDALGDEAGHCPPRGGRRRPTLTLCYAIVRNAHNAHLGHNGPSPCTHITWGSERGVWGVVGEGAHDVTDREG